MDNSERKAKLKWQSRRGMLELDLVFSRFIDTHLDTLKEEYIVQFERLLNCSDPELFQWFTGASKPQDEGLAKIVEFIKSEHQAN